MILEELVGSFVSLFSRMIIQTPAISRENLHTESGCLENSEQDEVCDGLIHREYNEQRAPTELQYNEADDISHLVQVDEQPRRNFCESIIRSFKANIGLITVVVFILTLVTIACVLVGLTTNDYCIDWIVHKNLSSPKNVATVEIAAVSFVLLLLFSWFPACVALCFGFKEFRKNYLLDLFVLQFVTESASTLYDIYFSNQLFTVRDIDYSKYRLPGYAIFLFSILCGAYLVARKCKKINPTTSYNVIHIFIIFLMPFAGSCLFGLAYRYVVIKYFIETEDRIKKAMIAAFTPGLCLPLIAVAKYILIRKSSEIITSDRAYVLCYFLHGGMIILYRTMQSGIEDIWLFIGLSLLHAVSNVLCKATHNLRVKIWTFFIKCYNRAICCGPKLVLQPLDSPRIRRFTADLEIQNILFEYTTVIVSQAYLASFILMNVDAPPWQVINGCLIRVALSIGIDFLFNTISVFIQIHCHNIPLCNVWKNYWIRHVVANVLVSICVINYFGGTLISVFLGLQDTLKVYKPRNCTSVF